jgi:spore coat protein A
VLSPAATKNQRGIDLPYTRRKFLHLLSASGIAAASPSGFFQMDMSHMDSIPNSQQNSKLVPPAALTVPQLNVFNLPPFVDPLPLPERIFAHHAQPTRIFMREVYTRLHPAIPPTRQWIYCSSATAPISNSVAPIIEARSNIPIEVEWINQLPQQHFLPIDHSLHGCGTGVPDVRTCVHLHGGRTPSADDGHPDAWFIPGAGRVCRYPLQQDATTLWVHDHAMGINRLNIYAGLFGMFLVRDSAEDALHLPSGRYELPLLLYDRELTTDGNLFYPVSPDPAKPWVTEFTGDAIIINGKLRPYLDVEPRLYRLRLLNASNSRFFVLNCANGPLLQIGSDQGLLAAPVSVKRLTLAPAERADLLIDFSSAAGQRVHLRSGAFDILEFRVGHQSVGQRGRQSLLTPATIPQTLHPVTRISESDAIITRRIMIREYFDREGRTMMMLLNGKHWMEPVTERPHLNSTEIWEFVNPTEDTHPMHLHLVRFQILNRYVFDVEAFIRRNEMHSGSTISPQPNEMGWKDVVQCPPGMVTRIIVKFEGYTGNYLYHCHILEHEANDMMRPFEVIP